MQNVTPSAADTQSPAKTPWLLSGALEPTTLVDAARSVLEDPHEGHWGFRHDAAYRRRKAPGGSPEITAERLEASRVHVDRHRGRQWSAWDLATMEEVGHRCAIPGDFGARTSEEIPKWFKCEGSDGAPLVPTRLRPLVALCWWAYAAGRFGVLANIVEMATELGVSPRTVRNHRAAAVRMGLLRKGVHAHPSRGHDHLEADRTWRVGAGLRPCDRASNIYRLGPVIEAFAGRAQRRR